MSEHAFDAGASGYDQIFAQFTRTFLPPYPNRRPCTRRVRAGVATGTGAAAWAAAEVVGHEGLVVATDFSVPMLEQARLKLGALPIRLAAMNGQALAFRSGTFDKVLCQFGLMFFPNSEKGMGSSGACSDTVDERWCRSPVLTRSAHFTTGSMQP